MVKSRFFDKGLIAAGLLPAAASGSEGAGGGLEGVAGAVAAGTTADAYMRVWQLVSWVEQVRCC